MFWGSCNPSSWRVIVIFQNAGRLSGGPRHPLEFSHMLIKQTVSSCVLAEEVQRRDVSVLRGHEKRVQQIPVGGERVALCGLQPPREAPEEQSGATERKPQREVPQLPQVRHRIQHQPSQSETCRREPFSRSASPRTPAAAEE